MESTYQTLAERVARLAPPDRSTPGRKLIALAGPPGSGKSTIAVKVLQALANMTYAPKAAVVSIDGFHLPLATLHALPNAAEAIARRGAPWTFDSKAALELVRKLKTGAGVVVVPTFDHAVKDPVADGLHIDADTEVCILEGNYLLCDEGYWSPIADLVDERWLVEVDPEVARARVASRHLAAGIEPTMELALARTDNNDIPNGEYVMQHSQGRYDLLIKSLEEPHSNTAP